MSMFKVYTHEWIEANSKTEAIAIFKSGHQLPRTLDEATKAREIYPWESLSDGDRIRPVLIVIKFMLHGQAELGFAVIHEDPIHEIRDEAIKDQIMALNDGVIENANQILRIHRIKRAPTINDEHEFRIRLVKINP